MNNENMPALWTLKKVYGVFYSNLRKELSEKSARIDKQIADLENQIENLEYEKRKLNI